MRMTPNKPDYKVKARPRNVLIRSGRGLPLVVPLQEISIDKLDALRIQWREYGFPKKFGIYDNNTRVVVWPTPDRAYYFDVEYREERSPDQGKSYGDRKPADPAE